MTETIPAPSLFPNETVTADGDLLAKLLNSNGHPIRLCDADGKTVGVALTQELARRFEIALSEALLRPEEVERVLADPVRYSTEDVFKLVKPPS